MMNGIEELYVFDLERKVFLLEHLAEGCKQHRAYRAIRIPRVDCNRCLALHAVREELKTL